MRIFLSWSGGRSRKVALALREWLPLVLHYAQPWMSDVDIAAGQPWGSQVENGLSTSCFGIICCTRDNLTAPWLLFEAGALAQSLKNETICPLVLDIQFTELSGPLAQFQAKRCDAGGLMDLVRAINRKAEQPITEGRLYELHLALWPKLYSEFNAISISTDERLQARSQPEMLEEVLAVVRDLTKQVQVLVPNESPSGSADTKGDRELVHPVAVVVEQIRELARAQASLTSVSSLADQVGVNVGTAKDFVDGVTRYVLDLRLWHSWYLRQLAEIAELLDHPTYFPGPESTQTSVNVETKEEPGQLSTPPADTEPVD